ncbi:hypothetical protein DFQ28_007661 [Apophysomyces sp. BC1034]|nr:hypothetical protein DFQ30_006512 [Apophysomyces sp. BC1015]KAG0176898.1 hypothetical protein DFQ29_005489 [Apophysomyces sp. BC1021]KAG0186516.1 hypothetical protein DFQ28_007661 [Apophysomyces sp. BC1034]
MAKVLALPTFKRLSDRVWRVLGLNPGKFTLQGTNTYILGAGSKKILIDTGEGKAEYLPLLECSLKEISPTAYISDIILTHGHRDHWGGVMDILSSALNQDSKIHIHKFPSSIADLPDIQVKPLHHGQIFQADSVTLKVIHTPGHTQDHCTFFLEEESSLFSADCVLGQGTAVFENLTQYMDGLRHLLTLNPQRLYPGHGPVVEDGVGKIKEYIRHREEREQQVIQLLKSHQKQWTPLDIVRELYKEYPESLHLPAAKGIWLVLLKLETDGNAQLMTGSSSSVALPELFTTRWCWAGN